MKSRMVIVALVATALLITSALAAETLESGPAAGKEIPGPFHPLNVTGANAGQKSCLVCEHGGNPVAMIFARKVNVPLTSLVKKIDAVTVKHKADRMGSFVVFLSDDEKLETQLKTLADQQKLQCCVLAIDNPSGPGPYKISKDADVTIILYEDLTVRANFAFKKGELNERAIERVMADIPKILSKK